ncbi:hypothetical protein QPM05_12005 [Caldibacillus thermoamylovorans]|nr:hypothetical protein [Caldibacillus thermoamylovorans]
MKEKYDDGDIFVNELEFRILKTDGCVVAKKSSFLPKNSDEKGSRRQKVSFSAQNDDEKESRRQKKEFLASKRRRERVSSPKSEVFRLKMTTKTGLVAKKRSFSAQNDDENGSRRQKSKFPGSKR